MNLPLNLWPNSKASGNLGGGLRNTDTHYGTAKELRNAWVRYQVVAVIEYRGSAMPNLGWRAPVPTDTVMPGMQDSVLQTMSYSSDQR